ncbi:MAG: hypothetical protein M3379_13475 [Acidobacteriota bacterium]|nr:hypothetical protein [Acidobacteriota bacterium]
MSNASAGNPASGGSSAGPPFSTTVKPYFTNCYRQHMNNLGIDLWDAGDVESNYDAIDGAVASGSMPPGDDECGPAWDKDRIDKFRKDFAAWKAGGFNPN